LDQLDFQAQQGPQGQLAQMVLQGLQELPDQMVVQVSLVLSAELVHQDYRARQEFLEQLEIQDHLERLVSQDLQVHLVRLDQLGQPAVLVLQDLQDLLELQAQ